MNDTNTIEDIVDDSCEITDMIPNEQIMELWKKHPECKTVGDLLKVPEVKAAGDERMKQINAHPFVIKINSLVESLPKELASQLSREGFDENVNSFFLGYRDETIGVYENRANKLMFCVCGSSMEIDTEVDPIVDTLEGACEYIDKQIVRKEAQQRYFNNPHSRIGSAIAQLKDLGLPDILKVIEDLQNIQATLPAPEFRD